MLACRVIMDQGIEVQAVKFVTPFFGYDLLANEEKHQQSVKVKYGIDVKLVDVSLPYLEMLRQPVYGYGKNFNPCVDCKILLLSTARRMMDEMGASFLITGEVIGQRPMSQRRDTLRVIERDSGCDGILLRPLCAKNMPPTTPEIQGWVDREKLYNFSGRGRQNQITLAGEYGITDYPTPAGGCSLTDPLLGKRVENYYAVHEEVPVDDARLLLIGRHFKLPGGGWLVIGRDEKENLILEASYLSDTDLALKNTERPGPLAILRYAGDDDVPIAASLVVRYSKKIAGDPSTEVSISGREEKKMVTVNSIDDSLMEKLRY